MSDGTVTLWYSGDDERDRLLVANRMSELRGLANEMQVNLSETKLETLSRCLMALGSGEMQLPPEEKRASEVAAINVFSHASEGERLAAASFIQEKLKAMYGQG